MKDKNYIGELKKDRYVLDMTQRDDDGEEEDDSPKFSPKSVDKYQLQFSYKGFEVNFMLPCFAKPIFDNKSNLDITFQSMLNSAINLFFISTDEKYKEKYKSFMSGSLDKVLKLDKKSGGKKE